MSRVPMGSTTMGQDDNGPEVHARFPDGLVNQGVSAELVAARWKLDRETLDAYSAESHRRSAEAISAGHFDREILPIAVTNAEGVTVEHKVDETVRASTTAEGLAGLRPSFRTDDLAARFPEIEWQIHPGSSRAIPRPSPMAPRPC